MFREVSLILCLTLLLPRFSRNCTVLSSRLLVLVSRLGHQFVGLGAAFDYPWLDSAGAITNFVAGNLKKVVFAKCLPDRFIRRHEPLRQKRIAGNGKAHLTGKLMVNRC